MITEISRKAGIVSFIAYPLCHGNVQAFNNPPELDVAP
jgi:hypothetical protein